MTVIMECNNICKEYGDNVILQNINLKIKMGEKIGIVGSNGTGKTTLANIITNIEEATSGSIIWNKDNIKIGYMKQSSEFKDTLSTLSGGEKTKKKLNEVLYGNYNMIILDEPTNHLDYDGLKYLISEISKFKGTVIIISHDRYFLDNTINKIVEIENKSISIYNGNYSWYRDEKKLNFENNMHNYIVQEKIKRNINSAITELTCWSNKAHNESRKVAIESGNKFGGKEYNRAKAMKMDKQIKSRIKRLEKIKIEGIDKPKEERDVFLTLNNAEKIGKIVVEAENIGKSFGTKTIINSSSFFIRHGEKVGIFGKNGCGKTTLINGLMGNIKIEGKLYIYSKRKIGYISQDVQDLNEDKTIIELFEYNNREEKGKLITKLNQLGFARGDLDKKINCLSLGERMKVKLLLMIQKQCDILILDEPTNHIDLHVREKLEEILENYNGTIILVTHDRYMLQKVCNKMLVFENKRIKRYEYTFDEYLSHIEKCKNKQNINEENKMIIENRISYVLGELCKYSKNSEEYVKYDEEYNKLLKLKKL